MLQSEKRIRVERAAGALATIASNPDKLDVLADKLDDSTVEKIESGLINAFANATIVTAAQIRAEESATDGAEPPRFNWIAVKNPGALPGNLNGAFACDWNGLKLEVKKLGPANYEGKINGVHIVGGKFKAGVRQRIEKEAAKRVG